MDGDERPGGPPAVGMDGPGQDALAGAALAAQQRCRLARRRLEGHLQGCTHPRLIGLQIDLGQDRPNLLFQLLDLRLQPPHPRDAIKQQAKLVGGERLGQVVEGPATHGLDRRFDCCIGRHYHHLQLRRNAEQPRQQVQPLLLGQTKVQQGHLERAMPQQFQGRRAVAGLDPAVPQHLQRHPQGVSKTGVVVDYEDVHKPVFCTIGRAICNAPAAATLLLKSRNQRFTRYLRLFCRRGTRRAYALVRLPCRQGAAAEIVPRQYTPRAGMVGKTHEEARRAMNPQGWNKFMVASLALAVGGILACTGAMLEVVMPSWSVVGFLATAILLGLSVGGIVAAFTWGCDRCEDYLHDKANNHWSKIGKPDISCSDAQSPDCRQAQKRPAATTENKIRPTPL